jgi:hypothetical protein
MVLFQSKSQLMMNFNCIAIKKLKLSNQQCYVKNIYLSLSSQGGKNEKKNN